MADYEPVSLRRQAYYFTYFRERTLVTTRFPFMFQGFPTLAAPPGVPPVAARRRLLDLAAVRWIVIPALQMLAPTTRGFVQATGLVAHKLSPSILGLLNPRAVPRAFVTYGARPAPEPAALLEALARDDFDPLTASFVEGDPGLPASAPVRGEAARFVVDDEETVEIEATLAQPGLVVLADAFAPGWRATVDGVAAPIYATNFLFRGVPAPTGTHRVRFEYRPRSVLVGAAASTLGLVVLVGLVVSGRRRGAAARV